MKKKVLILFSNAHLSYSPTVLGLYDLLSKLFDVTILAESPELYNNRLLTNRKIVYRRRFRTNKYLATFYRLFFSFQAAFNEQIRRLENLGMTPAVIFDFIEIKRLISGIDPNFIIAVDFKSLFYTQMLRQDVEFLSLEIVENDIFYAHCDFSNIKSVLIQTKERYNHLFKDKKFETFLIQNAPSYEESPDNSARQSLVYCGTAWNPFGFYHCLNFLEKYPDYTLHVKGLLFDEDRQNVERDHKDLISGKRLVIDSKYLDDSKVVDYLRQFKIGFCFYNFEVEWIDTFNYYSAPSGKMFKYFAAGVPVIGQNILGLQPVKEFDCGVLIEDLKPKSIKQAIEKIENNFEYYSDNCLKAARHYSFDKNAEPFIDYLLKNQAIL